MCVGIDFGQVRSNPKRPIVRPAEYSENVLIGATSFLVGLGAAVPLPALLAVIALVRREYRSVRRDLIVLFGAAVTAVNVGLFIALLAWPGYSAGAWNLFHGALGFGAGCAMCAFARALFTPNSDYVVILATIVSGGIAIPLAYYGWLLMPVAVVPGAPLAAGAGAWACHRIADGYPSPVLAFVAGVLVGSFVVIIALVPATMLSGLIIAILMFAGEYVL